MFLIGETRSIKFYIAPNGEKWLLRLLLRTVPTTTECRGQREGKCQRRGVRTTSQGTLSAWAGCLYGKLTQSRFSARDSCNLKTSSSGKVTWLTYPYSFLAIEEAGFRWLWFFGYIQLEDGKILTQGYVSRPASTESARYHPRSPGTATASPPLRCPARASPVYCNMHSRCPLSLGIDRCVGAFFAVFCDCGRSDSQRSIWNALGRHSLVWAAFSILYGSFSPM